MSIHTHSEHSEKDALPTAREIAEINKEMGNDKFCITDHGNISAWVQAYVAEEETGLQFIPGCEFYIIPEPEYWAWNTLHNDDVETVDYAAKYHHLLAIAKNQAGVKSLIRLYNSSEMHYDKPCITRESLFNNSDGLIILSACVAGEVPFYIINNQVDKARDIMKMYKEKFGDDYYCEIQFHNLNFVDEKELYNTLVKLARELDIPMVATTDSHFSRKEDVIAHDIYKDIYYRGNKSQYDYSKHKWNSAFSGDGYYIKNEDEIRETIKNIPELTQQEIDMCVKNSIVIADKCEKTEFPKARGLTDQTKQLRALVEAGFNKKRKGTEYEEKSRKRLEIELKVIEDMGFTEYFVNVYTIVKRAAMLGLLSGPGRGSGAGSEVNYLLDITKIDPIKNNLIFERFLNPSRWNYPDIDLDIQTSSARKGYSGKDILLESLSHDKFPFTGPIVNEVRATTLTLFKDVGRAMGIPYKFINKITTDSTVADVLFKEDTYSGWLQDELSKKGIPWDEKWAEFEKYIWFCYRYGGHDTGDNAHGLLWNRSVHASGVILYPSKDKDILPKGKNGVIYRGHDLEKMGYIKYDVLGLDALNAINEFIPRIEKDTGKKFDWERNNDASTWKVFKDADTDFVFQFSSDGMKRALRSVQPESISALAELNSLYRPGPIMAGIFDRYLINGFSQEEKIVGEFLKEEFGEQHSYAMIFQEDIMKVVQKMAGFSLAEADLVRRAMARKEADTMAEYKKQFVDGFNKEKYGNIAETVWKTIEVFASYTFNASHSVAYSCIAYWTAYLFAHYKDEYLQYLMNTNKKQRNLITAYLTAEGYKIVYPSLKTKNTEFEIHNRQIFLPTVAVSEEQTLGKYLLNLDTDKKKMIVKFGVLDTYCPDRKMIRELMTSLDKRKLKALDESQLQVLYEVDDLRELIAKFSALDLLDYTQDGDEVFTIKIKKARSEKEIKLHFLTNEEILQHNVQEDIRAYGIVRATYADSIEGFNYPQITKDFQSFAKNIKNSGELTTKAWEYYFRKYLDSVYSARFPNSNAVRRAVVKSCKIYERWGTAKLVFSNGTLDVGIIPPLLPFFKSLGNNTPVFVKLKIGAYFGKEGMPIYNTKIMSAKKRSF